MGKFGPCPECGQVIACDLPRCPYCRAELAPGTVEETAAGAEAGRREWRPRQPRPLPSESEIDKPGEAPAGPEVLPPPPAPPAPPGNLSRYRPTRSLGLALQLMFAAWMVLGGLIVAARFAEWLLLDELVSNPFALTFEQAAAAQDRALRLAIVSLVAEVVTGILFIVWMRRSYRNLLAFGLTSTRFPDGWAIGAWFVPILNLFRPKQIIDECWRESGTGRDPTVSYRYRQSTRIPVILNLWWGWMLAGVVFNSYFWVGSLDDPERLRFIAFWLSIGAVVNLADAGAAFWVVTLLTRRQAERASRLSLDKPPRPVPRPAALAVAAALSLAAVVASLLPFLTWHQPPAFATIARADDGEVGRYDSYGVSFEYPADYLAAESSGLGSGPPTEDYGMVALTPEDPALQDHFFVVEWATGLTVGDAVTMIDTVVDMITWTESGIPLVSTSEVVRLPFGSGDFTARIFSATEQGAWISGAVGFGMCPSGDRLAGIRYVYPNTNRQGTALDDLASVLATLSC
jgi:hypothetical protein